MSVGRSGSPRPRGRFSPLMSDPSDPKGTAMTCPTAEAPEREHQPREHAVCCRCCVIRKTWNTNAICDVCQAKDDSLDHLRAPLRLVTDEA